MFFFLKKTRSFDSSVIDVTYNNLPFSVKITNINVLVFSFICLGSFFFSFYIEKHIYDKDILLNPYVQDLISFFLDDGICPPLSLMSLNRNISFCFQSVLRGE